MNDDDNLPDIRLCLSVTSNQARNIIAHFGVESFP